MNVLNSSLARAALTSGAFALVLAGCGSNNGEARASAADTASGAGPVPVASADGTPGRTAAGGHTLYSAAVEKGGQIRCVDACTSFWQPVTSSGSQARAANAELGAGTFGTVDRPDGASQLTY